MPADLMVVVMMTAVFVVFAVTLYWAASESFILSLSIEN